jgi:hypothetical protein
VRGSRGFPCLELRMRSRYRGGRRVQPRLRFRPSISGRAALQRRSSSPRGVFGRIVRHVLGRRRRPPRRWSAPTSARRRDCCRARLTDDFVLAIHFSGLRWFGKLSSKRLCHPQRHPRRWRRRLTCEPVELLHGDTYVWSTVHAPGRWHFHSGGSAPAYSATMYSAYQSGQFGSGCPIRFSCCP